MPKKTLIEIKENEWDSIPVQNTVFEKLDAPQFSSMHVSFSVTDMRQRQIVSLTSDISRL